MDQGDQANFVPAVALDGFPDRLIVDQYENTYATRSVVIERSPRELAVLDMRAPGTGCAR